MSSKQKGDLLEDVVEQLCSAIEKVRVTRNAKVLGRNAKGERDIDVLIEGRIGAFPIKILVEAKNYSRPVGIERVESLRTKLDDVGANLGVIVCPKGFTKQAREAAKSYSIRLFEVFDPALGNSDLFIPIRYVEPTIKSFSFELGAKSFGPIVIPQDISRWRFRVGNKSLNARQLVWHAWNTEMIPQTTGTYTANFNAMTMEDTVDPSQTQYVEVKIHIDVIENYYLKLIPASFFREPENGKEHHNISIRLYSKEEDMLKSGWKKFETFEEMAEAANIINQPSGVKDIIMKPSYVVDLDNPLSED